MAKGDPSFGWLVFGKAVSETSEFLRYTRRDIALGLITVTLGLVLAYEFVGKADTMKEVLFIALFTFAPAGIVMISVFIWHLWLAPAALAYEAIKEAKAPLSPPGQSRAVMKTTAPKPSVNWTIWKQRSQYQIEELAAILSKNDPGLVASTTEQDAYQSLILEEVQAKKLPFIKEHGESFTGERYAKEVSGYTYITKVNAITWAEGKGFDLSHIK